MHSSPYVKHTQHAAARWRLQSSGSMPGAQHSREPNSTHDLASCARDSDFTSLSSLPVSSCWRLRRRLRPWCLALPAGGAIVGMLACLASPPPSASLSLPLSRRPTPSRPLRTPCVARLATKRVNSAAALSNDLDKSLKPHSTNGKSKSRQGFLQEVGAAWGRQRKLHQGCSHAGLTGPLRPGPVCGPPGPFLVPHQSLPH